MRSPNRVDMFGPHVRSGMSDAPTLFFEDHSEISLFKETSDTPLEYRSFLLAGEAGDASTSSSLIVMSNWVWVQGPWLSLIGAMPAALDEYVQDLLPNLAPEGFHNTEQCR
jgi:hypothetical protein